MLQTLLPPTHADTYTPGAITMSRRIAALRLILAAAAITTLAACASPTAPTTPRNLRAPSVNHDGTDTTCRSGWVIGDGRSC